MTGPLQQRWDQALMRNYGTPQLALAAGSGAEIVDADSNTYLDLLGGIAVNVLGHGNPAIAAAITAQYQTLGHVSNLYVNAPAVALAEALLDRWGQPGGRVFFTNSGTEANEAAFKLARRTGRPKIVAADGGFHGRSMGALAMTGQPGKRIPFEPMPAGVEFVPYGDAEALARAVDADTAAVILEPIQGEVGVVVPPPGYLAAARAITAEHGALLILDEVQTGMGRTGTFFAHQADGIVPDVVTLAKGLGGGLPIGACLATGAAAELFQPGDHGSTFGGNPVCAAAALAVLAEIDRLELQHHAAVLGKSIAEDIAALHDPRIAGVRGAGLLLAIVLNGVGAKAFEEAARAHGYLVNAPSADAIRLAPPLILTDAQAARFVADVPAIVTAAEGKS